MFLQFVQWFLEECVGDGEVLGRGPVLKPLTFGIAFVVAVCAYSVWVVVVNAFSYLCVAVGSNDDMYFASDGFLLDCGKGGFVGCD